MVDDSGEDKGRSHLVVRIKFKDSGSRNAALKRWTKIDMQGTRELEYLNKKVKGNTRRTFKNIYSKLVP